MKYLICNVLPLKDMAIRRLVAILFKDPNILESVRNFKPIYPYWEEEILRVWRETVEDKMLDKISKIGLPASLTKLLIDTAKPMGRQIIGWKSFHENYFFNSSRDFGVPFFERLRWTARGALDYRKTAEELICSDVVDIVRQYTLAGLYCLEDYIPLLWKELPEENKRFCLINCHVGKPLRQEFWWPYIIRGEHSKLDSLTLDWFPSYSITFNNFSPITFHHYAFQYSVVQRNKAAAAEYFFQKLTQEEIEASLITTSKVLLSSLNWGIISRDEFPKEKASEMFLYLLSVMTPDQQMRIFQEKLLTVLEYFLRWPLQDQFSEIADLIWNFIPESFYDFLLRKMYERFQNSGYYFQILFREFFRRMPFDRRKSFVDQEREPGSYFDLILELGDKEALELTFRSADAATRVGLVCSELALTHFHRSISRDRCDVVEVCLREARLSKDDRERLRRETREGTRLSQLLDETVAQSKRCSEDETPTLAKMKKT